jgi:hypothetical protein
MQTLAVTVLHQCKIEPALPDEHRTYDSTPASHHMSENKYIIHRTE